jgi:dTDP-4-dehydrorhamnose 3,5-epimerase-like enzyme
VQYKVDQYFCKKYDRSILWNDSYLNIDWPISNPILSEKDKNAKRIKDIETLRDFT